MIARAMTAIIVMSLPVVTYANACPVLESFITDGQLAARNGVEVQCTISRVLGAGRSQDCFWRYPLRSEAAQDHFISLLSELRACADGPVEAAATGVNHPDSFDQITGEVSGVAVSLSLKDKGGLSKTLVVLRRHLP